MQLGDVPGNPFYDAAVHTMSQSLHAFLFGALDPSGNVSIDKPPVDLWAQVVSVKLFGFSPTTLKLPQALAGTAAIPLLYDFVRRPFGRAAGLAAAAALAVLPVAVITARSDTMDTLLALVLLVAAWLVLRAVETGRVAWLVAAGATVGLAFNVKLFQALVPLPAFALLWLIASSLPMRRRLRGLVAAGLVALVVAFAWIVPVGLTPASQRPYPIGSTDGSIWNLVFVFNGIDRLKGRSLTTPDTLPAGTKLSPALARRQRDRARRRQARAGPAALLASRYRGRISSELVAGIVAAVAAVLAALAARGARAPRDRLRVGVAACLGVWLLTGLLLFSTAQHFKIRYFETVSPALAAVLGIALTRLALSSRSWQRLLAIPVLLLAALYARSNARFVGQAADLVVPLAAVASLLLAATAVPAPAARSRALRMAAATMAVVAVLAAPAAVSRVVVTSRAHDAQASGSMPRGWPPLINRYLSRHRDGAYYGFASVSPAKGAPLVANHPEPVLTLTSYRSQPLVSVRQLAHEVRAGRVRFFLIGSRCRTAYTRRTAACPATARWAVAHSTDVSHAIGLPTSRFVYRVNSARP